MRHNNCSNCNSVTQKGYFKIIDNNFLIPIIKEKSECIVVEICPSCKNICGGFGSDRFVDFTAPLYMTPRFAFEKQYKRHLS